MLRDRVARLAFLQAKFAEMAYFGANGLPNFKNGLEAKNGLKMAYFWGSGLFEISVGLLAENGLKTT